MAGFINNMYTDKFCRRLIDPTSSLREGDYYGWMHNSVGIEACVKAGTFYPEHKRFCLVFPLLVNKERNALEVRDPAPQLCFDSQLTTVKGLTRAMLEEKPTSINTPASAPSGIPS